MNREEAIRIIKAFAAGEMTAEEFWVKFKTGKTIRNILVKDEKKWEKKLALASPTQGTWSSSALGAYNMKINFQSYRETDYLHWVVRKYISRNHMPFKFGTFYTDRLVFLMDIQPSWLEIEDEDFLKELISRIPADITTRKEKVKWCKNELKKEFRYDRSPPRWIQFPEWPIVNGKPLVFKGQSKETIDNEQVDFYFYDPDTKEETTVTQYY